MVAILEFCYQGKYLKIGIPHLTIGESYENLGSQIMDTYIERLAPSKDKKCRLYYWYIDDEGIGHGVVTGHTRIADSMQIHTSMISDIIMLEEDQMLILFTRNSVYYCPLSYCRFEKQDMYLSVIPDYENIKLKYAGKIKEPMIEVGNVLLVLSNFNKYYFHSLYYEKETCTGKVEYDAYPHIGTFQDSFLIIGENGEFDIRYFPHFQNIAFYLESTNGKPFYIENIGDVTIYCKTSCGLIRLDSGERKMVCIENAEKEGKVRLPEGDLYPAKIIDL